jgi:hypothetical protein
MLKQMGVPMRIWFVFTVSLWAWVVLASPPVPNAKELAKEATRLGQLADQEADPTQKQELRTKACNTWSAAYDAGLRIEYQLAISLCKQEIHDLEGAEEAARLFLIQAPPNHQSRALGEQLLEKIVAQRQVEHEATNPPALSINGPIPMEESPKQWKRRALFATGVLGGLGLVAGAITFGALRAQNVEDREVFIAVEKP